MPTSNQALITNPMFFASPCQLPFLELKCKMDVHLLDIRWYIQVEYWIGCIEASFN